MTRNRATRMNVRILVAVAVLLTVAGCGKSAEDPPAASEPAGPSFVPMGTWTVVGHSLPGISAMTDDAATARHGQTLQLTETAATSSGERCDSPKYPTRSVPTEEFLATEFNLPPESLKPFEGRDQLTLVEISCDGAPWTAFGSLLLVIDADHVLTPWDGVFFELERTSQAGG